MILSSHFDPAQFVAEYWQKKPVVIRQLLPGFEDPLDEHELAGLAQEVEVAVDSRVVSHHHERWHVEHGPFDDFSTVCQGAWSLLVQGVDRFSESTHALMSAFSFLPSWRTEDVMVSFSVEGAGVGPHLDQYDVFIIQGKGSRRWQVGAKDHYESVIPHPKLRQITGFEPIIDEILQPGDALYIPPGFPHNGVALEACMNYSVGFRAPTQAELISAFADHALDNRSLTRRFADPNLVLRQRSAQITKEEVTTFRQLLHSAIDSDEFEFFLGAYLSAPLCSEDSLPPTPFTEQSTLDALKNGAIFIRALESRHLELPQPDGAVLAVNGVCHSLSGHDLNLAIEFLNSAAWQSDPAFNYENCLFFVRFVTTLLDSGYWYLE